MPVPVLFMPAARVAAVRQAIAGPPDAARLPWSPLPKVDADAAAKAVEVAEKRRQAAAPTSEMSGPVRSAFSSTPTAVTGGGGGLFGASRDANNPPSGGSNPRFGAPESKPAGAGGGRTGNQALADALAKKMQQKGQ